MTHPIGASDGMFIPVLFDMKLHSIPFLGRLMEKENKKARDDARKEYNESVRVCHIGPCVGMCRLTLSVLVGPRTFPPQT